MKPIRPIPSVSFSKARGEYLKLGYERVATSHKSTRDIKHDSYRATRSSIDDLLLNHVQHLMDEVIKRWSMSIDSTIRYHLTHARHSTKHPPAMWIKVASHHLFNNKAFEIVIDIEDNSKRILETKTDGYVFRCKVSAFVPDTLKIVEGETVNQSTVIDNGIEYLKMLDAFNLYVNVDADKDMNRVTRVDSAKLLTMVQPDIHRAVEAIFDYLKD